MHHILLCIQTNHTVEDEDGMEFASDEFYYKSGGGDAHPVSRPSGGRGQHLAKLRSAATWSLSSARQSSRILIRPNGQENTAYFRDDMLRRACINHYGEQPEQVDC